VGRGLGPGLRLGAFEGGRISSDAGAVLLGQTNKAIRLVSRLAQCFQDGRDPDATIHQLPALLGQALGVASRAEAVLARQIAVRRADGKRRRDGDVGQAEVGERAFDQFAAGRAAADAFAHVEVQHRAAGVLGLQSLLPL